MRHGRRSRPILLNLGVRRLVVAETEVEQTASEMSNNCLLASKFDLFEAEFIVGYTCPPVWHSLTGG